VMRRNSSTLVCRLVVISVASIAFQNWASAADQHRPSGVLDQLLSIFVPPYKSDQPAHSVSLQTSKPAHASPLYPYGADTPPAPKEADAYRTVCVRLCDGYYWPISDATSMSRFQRDRNSCESSCEQPAKLYYQPAGDTNAAHLVSLDGNPYPALPHAFSYRSALTPSCRCKPEPWSDSEIERHQRYTLDSQGTQAGVAEVPTPPPANEDAAAQEDPVPDTDVQAGNPAAEAAANLPVDDAVPANAEPVPASGGRDQTVDGSGHIDIPLR